MYMSVTPVVFYLSIGFAGCSVGLEISCGARKLTRTPQVKKKKIMCSISFSLLYP